MGLFFNFFILWQLVVHRFSILGLHQIGDAAGCNIVVDSDTGTNSPGDNFIYLIVLLKYVLSIGNDKTVHRSQVQRWTSFPFRLHRISIQI